MSLSRLSLIVTAGLLLGSWATVHAQSYGLPQRPVSGAFLNNVLPQTEASTTGWSYADAFPALSFDDPTFIVAVPGSDRLLVGNQRGLIHTIVDSAATTTKAVFLDLTAVTQGTVGSGMMGFAFHPEYGVSGSPNRGYIYVFYSYSPAPNYTPGVNNEAAASYNRLSRFTVPDGATAADPNSELVLINQYDRHLWHAGGAVCFDADGFLYLSCGDEGGNNDPYNHGGGKINESFFCGVLRIDVDQNPSRSHPIRRQPVSGATPPLG
jgi:glucose/arabinose dehydrogenase